MPRPAGALTPAGGGGVAVRRLVACALGLALGPAVALGLARFAYSLLLPAMRAELGWSYTQAGLMNTANAAGYLAGALLTGWVARRLGARRTFAAGMVIAAVALFAAAATASFTGQLVLRLTAGIGAALTFITGAALTAALGRHAPHRSGLLLSVYTAGAGGGIVVSGLTVQPLLATTGADAWRWSWMALAVLSTASLLAAVPALRRAVDPDPTPGPATATDDRGGPRRRVAPLRALMVPAVGYLLFGGGYIAYVTFIIAFLRGQGLSASTVTVFWTLLGLAAIAGVPAWGPVMDRLRSGHALALMNAALVAASLLVLLAAGPGAGLASAVLFGSSFLAVPAATAHLARRRMPPATWTAAIGGLTVAFAIGQCLGPALAGLLAQRTGGTAIGVLIAVVVLGLAALINLAAEHRPIRY